jgi:hypothetical protein
MVLEAGKSCMELILGRHHMVKQREFAFITSHCSHAHWHMVVMTHESGALMTQSPPQVSLLIIIPAGILSPIWELLEGYTEAITVNFVIDSIFFGSTGVWTQGPVLVLCHLRHASRPFLFYHFYIYSHVYTLFGWPPPTPFPTFWAEQVLPSCSLTLLKRRHKR